MQSDFNELTIQEDKNLRRQILRACLDRTHGEREPAKPYPLSWVGQHMCMRRFLTPSCEYNCPIRLQAADLPQDYLSHCLKALKHSTTIKGSAR